MYISPTDAVKLYDVSKPTLYKDMTDGKISFSVDDRQKRKLNVAELDRLYAKRKDFEPLLTFNGVNDDERFTGSDVKDRQVVSQIRAIREQIEQSKDREIELLEKQIEQLMGQVESVNRHLEETREEHRVYVRLLEDKRDEQSRASQWDQEIQKLKAQLNQINTENRLLLAKEEERKKRIEARQKRRELERLQNAKKNRSFFERLFG